MAGAVHVRNLRRQRATAERLEWYGDAVLEQLVSRLLLRCLRPQPTPDRQHLSAEEQLRDVLANAALLPPPHGSRKRRGAGYAFSGGRRYGGGTHCGCVR